MIISTVTMGEVERGVHPFEVETEVRRDYVERMIKTRGDIHNHLVAKCLGNASVWAYSDADTFARMMHRRGGIPYNETVSVRFTNNALLIDTEVFVCQSKDKKLVILAFGGTNPVNLIQLLLDATPKKDAFWTLGNVHGGFFRAALALWPTLKKLLLYGLHGESICSGAESERRRTQEECEHSGGVARGSDTRNGAHDSEDEPSEPPNEDDRTTQPTLYITGHSLGGALAVLTAALIYRDHEAEPIWNSIRAIYTYGQPMVGHGDFVENFRNIIGHKVFRHIYEKDLVPTMPSMAAGPFAHIGAEFRSAEYGWLPQTTHVKQASSFLTSFASGTVAFLVEQLPDFWTLPLFSRLRILRRLRPLLPEAVWRDYCPQVSLYDHLPLNYLRTSRMLPHGSEFL